MRALLLIIFIIQSIGLGAFLEDIPVNVYQPDGSKIFCFSSGDEYYVRLHDEKDYTIVQNLHDGFYYYAQLFNDTVEPTIYRADHPIPEIANLQSGIGWSAR